MHLHVELQFSSDFHYQFQCAITLISLSFLFSIHFKLHSLLVYIHIRICGSLYIPNCILCRFKINICIRSSFQFHWYFQFTSSPLIFFLIHVLFQLYLQIHLHLLFILIWIRCCIHVSISIFIFLLNFIFYYFYKYPCISLCICILTFTTNFRLISFYIFNFNFILICI